MANSFKDDQNRGLREMQSLEEIGKKFLGAEQVFLFPHIYMDGDALGSSCALCIALKKAGVKAAVLVGEKIPEYIEFLDRDCCIDVRDKKKLGALDVKNGVCICVDCGEPERLSGGGANFLKGKDQICIDHHGTSKAFAHMNYIDSSAAATGEIIFDLIKAMGIEIDSRIGEGIYTAIVTDTGNFKYMNTTSKTHRIAAELLEAGVDHEKITIAIYQSSKPSKIIMNNKVMSQMMILEGGRGAVASVSKEILRETGTELEDTEGMVEALRDIKGVELAALIKELKKGEVKISLRSKAYVDTAEIAVKFGGGGHLRAAGFNLKTGVKEAEEKVKEIFKEVFQGESGK